VMMPGMDGFEVARRIRNQSPVPDIPICMVTALSGKEERLRAVEAGANDFIAKPIDKTELRVRTASLLKAKEVQDTIKRYQAQLEAQNRLLQENYEQLRKLGEQKDEFVRIASHDLKNPITCILGFADIINSRIPPGTIMTAETHSLTARIAAQCRVMKKIIEDFLDFQALEDGQIKLTLEAVDLNELARDVLERNAGYAAKKMMTSHLDLEPSSLLVHADKSRLNQVLENFVSNAIKFSPEGQQVTVCTRRTESGVLVEVRDSGPGLTDEDMKNLFVKYAKLSNLPTGDEKSTGLGLAICKKVVEIQGGKTGARNNPEGGATFWFELPETQI
jgi:two-component system sensor histidine kinase/response regulator